MRKNERGLLVLASAIVNNSQGMLLLLKRSNSNRSFKECWQLPEGKLEFGETPKEALERELQEEIGLSSFVSKLLFVSSAIMQTDKKIKYHSIRIVYKVEWSGAKIKLSDDHSEYLWIKPKEVFSLDKRIDGLDEVVGQLVK